jgi:probable F420-dependent oxidoreductase
MSKVRFNLMFPARAVKHFDRWMGDGSLAEVGRLAEDHGFDAISMTEHPFPDDAWLNNGGHHAFDPFVSLSFLAAATKEIRLVTYIAVSGYRSPYLLAKAAASLDNLSGGRFVLGMAAGYLETEFEVLGADFGRRGALLDAAIPAMRAAWTGETVHRRDPLFPADGHTMLPRPRQAGGPPIWIGGNSTAAKRRAVALGDGWMPIGQSVAMSKITRTPPLETVDDLRRVVADVQRRRADAGAAPLEVMFAPFEGDLIRDVDAYTRAVTPRLGEYADAGVTWITVEPASRSLAAFRDDLGRLADALTAKVG